MRSKSMWRRNIRVLVGALALGLGMSGWAFAQGGFMHLVSHRDQNGNLVYPRATTKPVPKSAPLAQKTVVPAQPQRFSFRQTQWGMGMPEVKAAERATLAWELHTPILAVGTYRLGYHLMVEDIPAALSYTFENDVLTTAKYVFEAEYGDEAKYLEDFRTIKDWITQTYGPPQTEEELWLDDLYRYSQELWGKAVLRGHLTLVAEWEAKGTSIVLVLNGGNDTIGMMAEFAGLEQPPAPKFVRVPSISIDS